MATLRFEQVQRFILAKKKYILGLGFNFEPRK